MKSAFQEVLLFEEKRDLQRKRLNTRKMAISRRGELANQERLLTRKTVKGTSSEEGNLLKNDEDDYL